MLPLLAFRPVIAAGGLMDINPGLTLWTGITFLILLFVLSKYAWGPIVRTLQERERTITDAIEQAKKERAEAERMMAEQKEALSASRREAAEFARKNQQEIEALRGELTARAKKEADELLDQARRTIE